MPVTIPTDKSNDSRRRITDAARGEIESKGILGLRVQDVARNAGVSVPLIYKYFGDRDGLLAEVLSQMFVDCSVRHLVPAGEILSPDSGRITTEKLVQVLMLHTDAQSIKDRALTVQTFAAASEIPLLAERLALTQREIHTKINHFLLQTFTTMNLDDNVPIAALSMLIQSASLGQIFNDVMGPNGVSDDDMVRLLQILVDAVVEAHTPRRS